MVLVTVFALLALFSIISIVMSAEDPPALERSPRRTRSLGDARPPLGAAHSLLHDAPAPAGAFRFGRTGASGRRADSRRPYNAGSATALEPRSRCDARAPDAEPVPRSARPAPSVRPWAGTRLGRRRARRRAVARRPGLRGGDRPAGARSTSSPRARRGARRASRDGPARRALPADRQADRRRRLAVAPGPPRRRARPRAVRPGAVGKAEAWLVLDADPAASS